MARRLPTGKLLSAAETAIYVGIAVVLSGLAAVVTISSVTEFVSEIGSGDLREISVSLLDSVLLVLMLVEILHTVGISIREHVLVPEPFLIVGLIAAIRRVLVLTAEQGLPTAETAVAFRLVMIELGLLTVLAVGFVGALVLLSRARSKYGSVAGPGSELPGERGGAEPRREER